MTSESLDAQVQGIQHSTDLDFPYLSAQGNETQAKINNLGIGIPYGKPSTMLAVDGHFGPKEVGFFYKGQHYHINKEFKVMVGKSSNKDTMYIPLEPTSFKRNAGTKDNENLVSALGIAGSAHEIPLVISHAEEYSVNSLGFFDNEGSLGVYTMSPESEIKLRTMLLRPANFHHESINLTYDGKTSKATTTAAPTVVTESKTKNAIDFEDPTQTYKFLSSKVIGQETPLKELSVAFANYMTMKRTGHPSLKKQNILDIGPSGVGKTYSLITLFRAAGLPFVETKMTGKSTEGLVGENFSSTFEYFRQKTAEPVPYGAMLLDEIDKLTLHDMGIQLMGELVGNIEQAEVAVGKGKTGDEAYSTMDTKNILFIAAGAFQGVPGKKDSLATIIQKRIILDKVEKYEKAGIEVSKKQVQKDLVALGDQHALSYVTPDDIIQYGLIPELVGRFPVISVLHPLSVNDKTRILNELDNSPLAQNKLYLELKGYTVEMEPEVSKLIAEFTPDETGARGLESVCSKLFNDIHFDPKSFAKDKTIYIDTEKANELIMKSRKIRREDSINQTKQLSFNFDSEQ